jgi:hypothetical protein
MSATSRRLLWALRLLALGLIALQLAAPLFGEETAWGLWPATYLPAGWRWGLALIAGLVTVSGTVCPVVPGTVCPAVPGIADLRFPAKASLPTVKISPTWIRLALAALAAIPFYLLRIVHTRWGDAYILVNAIPHPQARLTYTWQAPLDLFIHAKVWALGHRLFGWADAMPAYWLLSTLAGVLFVWVLLGLASWLGRDRPERALLIGLVLTLGTMQLFFGYIENYSFMTVGVLLYAWLALRALAGEIALLWPASALALTHAFHPSTLILVPSLVYLACVRGSRGAREQGGKGAEGRGNRGGWCVFASVGVPYVLVGLGVLALMTAGGHGLDALFGADYPGGGDRRWFVPLFATATRWEHYTMFSLGHLRDIANEQLLTAPAIVPASILAALLAWRRLPTRDRAFRLLLIMAASYLLFIWTWNPDYGGRRDWDLFAPAAVPVALLLGYVLPRVLPERAGLRSVGRALIAVQALHTIAWVYQNTRPWTWP